MKNTMKLAQALGALSVLGGGRNLIPPPMQPATRRIQRPKGWWKVGRPNTGRMGKAHWLKGIRP